MFRILFSIIVALSTLSSATVAYVDLDGEPFVITQEEEDLQIEQSHEAALERIKAEDHFVMWSNKYDTTHETENRKAAEISKRHTLQTEGNF